jgi:hypothetical protein
VGPFKDFDCIQLIHSSDYAVAAFAVIIIISVFQWFIDGRKNFTGPRVDVTLDALDTVPTHEEEPAVHEK